MRKVSFRPALTLRGRTFKGLRGWAGKPLHPPLTDIPVGAYMLVAAFDVISFVGHEQEWARELYRAGTFALVGGAVVSLAAALTGFWDWLKSTKKGTQARRTVNAHAWTMMLATVIVLVDIVLRWSVYDGDTYTGAVVLTLTLAVAVLTIVGGSIGGSLAYDYGFNVETSGDHPVWHESEVDVFPGHKP